MKPTAATRHPSLEILGRPEGGLGETGPTVVSPSVSARAKRDIVAMLHQLINTLNDLAEAAPITEVSPPAQDLPLLVNAVEAGRLLSISGSWPTISTGWWPSPDGENVINISSDEPFVRSLHRLGVVSLAPGIAGEPSG